jgi:hypothetical protein
VILLSFKLILFGANFGEVKWSWDDLGWMSVRQSVCDERGGRGNWREMSFMWFNRINSGTLQQVFTWARTTLLKLQPAIALNLSSPSISSPSVKSHIKLCINGRKFVSFSIALNWFRHKCQWAEKKRKLFVARPDPRHVWIAYKSIEEIWRGMKGQNSTATMFRLARTNV